MSLTLLFSLLFQGIQEDQWKRTCKWPCIIQHSQSSWDSGIPEITLPTPQTVFYFILSFQIALYLAKRDFVDHVDSVEVVGVFCNSHNTLIRTFDYFKSNPIPPPPPLHPLSNPQRALSKSTPLVSKAEKVRVKKNFCSRDETPSCGATKIKKLFLSLSWQCSSTSPVPSATEAMTWTSWACPSGETSGSSASRCTPPPANPPSQRWWTSS